MRRGRCSSVGRGVVAALGAVVLGLVPTGLAIAQSTLPPPGVGPSPDRHEITRRVRGEDHPDTAQGSNNLAESQPAQRTLTGTDAQQAQALEKQVYELMRAGKFVEDAGQLMQQQRYAEAESLHRRALEIRRRILGDDHHQTAATYAYLALNLQAQGKYADAEPLFRTALEIRRRILGDDHPDMATSYNNLARNLDARGKHAEAGPLYQQALAIRLRALGDDHPDTAASCSNLAANLNDRGKYAEAEPLLQKALAIRLRALGDDHPDTATSYNNLAVNLNARGKYAEAEPLFQKALAICRRVLGEDHLDTITVTNNLALNLQAQGKYADAKPLFRTAPETRRRALDEGHPQGATVWLVYHILIFNIIVLIVCISYYVYWAYLSWAELSVKLGIGAAPMIDKSDGQGTMTRLDEERWDASFRPALSRAQRALLAARSPDCQGLDATLQALKPLEEVVSARMRDTALRVERDGSAHSFLIRQPTILIYGAAVPDRNHPFRSTRRAGLFADDWPGHVARVRRLAAGAQQGPPLLGVLVLLTADLQEARLGLTYEGRDGRFCPAELCGTADQARGTTEVNALVRYGLD